MADIQLRDVIDNLRSRLQAELDSELAAVASSHEQALEATRREAATQAEQQWAGRLEAVRADWSARLQSEVTAARTDVERQMVAETMRVRVDAEQAAAESSAELRRELEQALTTERKRAAEEIRAERQRTSAAIAEASKTPSSSPDASRLVAALRGIDEATSLTGVLRATVRAASAEAPRATMLIVNGAELDEWTAPDAASLGAGAMRVDGREAGFLSHVLKRGEAITSGNDMPLPAFAAIPAGRKAIGAPLLLGGEPVAVLYADEGHTGQAQGGWLDAVQVLARHGAASLACLTAQRTLQALGAPGRQGSPAFGGTPPAPDDGEGARRYARLLVSEIKLYNEAAVKTGRQMRDLLQRLRPEIERARRLYEERVPAAVAARDMFFHQELVQTLAGGDPSLLG